MAKTKRIRKTTKRVIQSANTITEGIINTILLEGFSASRINTQGQWDEKAKAVDSNWWEPNKRGRWRESGSRNGFFDIAACVAGLFVVIEIKYNGDEMSDEQLEFKAEVEKAGGIAVEFATFAAFQVWWNETMMPVINEWRALKIGDVLKKRYLEKLINL